MGFLWTGHHSEPAHLPAITPGSGDSQVVLRLSASPISIVIEPGAELTAEQFETHHADLLRSLGERSPRTIHHSLDGYLKSARFLRPESGAINSDHHEGEDRVSTPSTCKQVFELVMSGRMCDLLQHGAVPHYIYVNDCDLDVCLSLWILHHREELRRSQEICERVRALVELEDRIDRRCGFEPLDSADSFVRSMIWINEPFVELRKANGKFERDAQKFGSVITDIMRRISAFAASVGEERSLLPSDTAFEVVERLGSWAIVVERGYYARSALSSERESALALIRMRDDGTIANCTICKRNPGLSFPLDEVQAALNRAERNAGNIHGCWGGAQGFFTAKPRGRGTVLSLDEVKAIVNSVIQAQSSKGDIPTVH